MYFFCIHFHNLVVFKYVVVISYYKLDKYTYEEDKQIKAHLSTNIKHGKVFRFGENIFLKKVGHSDE